MSTVHLAGLRVEIAGRIIQRCAICGYKLVDSKNIMVLAKPDGTPEYDIPTWEPYSLVSMEVDGSRTCFHLMEPEPAENGKGNKIPEGFCVDLIEN